MNSTQAVYTIVMLTLIVVMLWLIYIKMPPRSRESERHRRAQ